LSLWFGQRSAAYDMPRNNREKITQKPSHKPSDQFDQFLDHCRFSIRVVGLTLFSFNLQGTFACGFVTDLRLWLVALFLRVITK